MRPSRQSSGSSSGSSEVGLLLLGILDSSFLFAPLGNDLLVVAMTAHRHTVHAMLYYAFMSTVGSVLGCLLVDLMLRRAGEKGLEKHLPAKRLEYVKCKVRRMPPGRLSSHRSCRPLSLHALRDGRGRACSTRDGAWRRSSAPPASFRFTAPRRTRAALRTPYPALVEAPAVQWVLIGLIVVVHRGQRDLGGGLSRSTLSASGVARTCILTR